MPGRQFAGVQASWPHLAGSPLEGGRKVRIRLPPEESLQTIGSSPAGAMRAPSNRAPQKRNDTIHRCPRTGSSNPPPSATSPATATARSDRRRRARPGNGLRSITSKHRVSKTHSHQKPSSQKTLCWRKADSNSRSLREGKGYGQPLQASIAVSDLNL